VPFVVKLAVSALEEKPSDDGGPELLTGRSRSRRRLVGLAVLVLAVAAPAACTSGPDGAASSSGSSPPSPSNTSSTSAPSAPTPTTPATSPTPPVTSSTTRAPSCGERLAATLTPAQRAGQLIMVGLQSGSSVSRLAAQARTQHLGGVVLLGGWHRGAASVSAATATLQRGSRIPLLVAADQEGGQVQQLQGAGFTRIPSARTQATLGTGAEQARAHRWATELRSAGVTVDLAPVADTVPTSLGSGNGPIGRYQRDFAPGSPQTNARYAAAFVRGSLAAGVAPTLKHFPGLGRVTGNTDVTSTGTTDRTTSATDPYLVPFVAGIRAGAPLVMVSSARYPRIDPDNRAMFSRAVITGVLRARLGFRGVVVSDDVGVARAVATVPVGQRATRFVGAGGDIVLTANAAQAPVMLEAIAAKRAASRGFAAQVDAAAARVLDLKADLGLAKCP
jgi:beta-N-acetylhexosaminidase